MSERETLAAQLRRGIAELGLEVDTGRQDKLLDYLELLRKWNSAYNLSGIKEAPRMLSLHLLDSLSVLPYVEAGPVLDVGTGGGLPGIPLAICRPDIRFILLDSNSKKTRFLLHCAALLGLRNVEVRHARAERFQSDERIAIVVTRAFSSLRQALDWTGHLLDADSRLLAMKGHYPADELAELPPGFRLAAAHAIALPGEDCERHLLDLRRAPAGNPGPESPRA